MTLTLQFPFKPNTYNTLKSYNYSLVLSNLYSFSSKVDGQNVIEQETQVAINETNILVPYLLSRL